MRILVLNQYFRPDQAASAQRITDLAEDLAACHHVTVVAGRPSYDAAATEQPSGQSLDPNASLRVWYVPSTTLTRARVWKRVLNYVTYLAGASIAGLFVVRPDVIITATDPPLLSVVGLWLSRLHRASFVQLMWDVQPEVAVAAGLLKPGRLSRALSAINAFALRRAASVIVPTNAIGRTIVEMGVPRDRVQTISHWEDLNVVRVRPKINPFSCAEDLAHRFVVMYAGNLGLTQQLDRYLELADRLRDLPDFRLVFIGDGAAKDALQARAGVLNLPAIRFLPYQPRERMEDSLGAADVFLAPLGPGLTRFMLPSKIYTIMATGRPVIATLDASSDLCDLLREAECGFVVEPGDVSAVEQHIRWLHANPDARQTMGERGRHAAETQFARSIVTPQFLDLLSRFEHIPVEAISRVP